MAESLAERLKRIAREKAASAAGGASGPAVVVEVVSEVTQPVAVIAEVEADEVAEDSVGRLDGTCVQSDRDGELHASATDSVDLPSSSTVVDNSSESSVGSGTTVTKPASTHPLAMAFAELEAGLLARDPEFKTKLRDIHRHLGKDPELVTMMTEEEIKLIVTGMVVFANAEIVEPAAKKSAKAAVKAASKVAISADDL